MTAALARTGQPQNWQRQKTETEALDFSRYQAKAAVLQHARPKPARVVPARLKRRVNRSRDRKLPRRKSADGAPLMRA